MTTDIEEIFNYLPEVKEFKYEIPPVPYDDNISPTEVLVLDKLSYGLNNVQIAAELCTTDNMVYNHRSSAARKFDVPNAVAAVDEAFERNLLELELKRPGEVEVSDDEQGVLRMIAGGLTVSQSVRELGIDKLTVVRAQRSLIFKLGALSFGHVIRLAREAGIPTRAAESEDIDDLAKI